MPSSLVNPRMASMLCSREVLPPGLRSRWPASEQLASAMAGAKPGRCMGSAAGCRAPPAYETDKGLEACAWGGGRPSHLRGSHPRSSS